MSERGVIENRKRKQQILDFRGLKYGKITPTDIDLSLDFQGKAFVFGEVKYGDACLPVGQRVHLENLVKAIGDSKRRAIAIVARHDVNDCAQDVLVHRCKVSELYFDSERYWRAPKHPITVKEVIDFIYYETRLVGD